MGLHGANAVPSAWGPSTLSLLLLARSLLLIQALNGIRLISPTMEKMFLSGKGVHRGFYFPLLCDPAFPERQLVRPPPGQGHLWLDAGHLIAALHEGMESRGQLHTDLRKWNS